MHGSNGRRRRLAKARREAAKHPKVVHVVLDAVEATTLLYTPRRATLAELARKDPKDIVGSPEWIAENRRLMQVVNGGRS